MDFSDGILKEHNKQPYINIVQDVEDYGKSCAIHATGTGKMYLALKWLNDNKKEPFIFCAPSLTILNKFADLVLQTYFKEGYLSLKNETIENKLEIIRTVLNNENINLITYSKLNFMEDEEMLNMRVKNVVLDEFHHLGADKWGSATEQFLHLHKDKKILGLSATPIRPSDKQNMVESLFDGRISSIINLEDAVGKILPYPTMIYGVYSFKEQINELEEKLESKLINEQVKLTVREKIKEARRIIEKADGIQEVFNTIFSKYNIEKGKFIVFCSSIDDMQLKMEECKSWFKEGTNIKIRSVSSDENYSENGKVISSFEKEKFDGIDLLFSVNMLNEGLHVDDLDGVIMLRPTNSNIVFLQQLGRALAVSDVNKHPLVFDLVNNVNIMRKDMEQFRETFSGTGFGEGKDNVNVDFALHSQVVDIIDYLESVYRYNTSRRIRDDIFLEYCKDSNHPTLENIRTNEKFVYQGKTVNIGNMLEVLRAQYKLRDSKIEQIGKITRPLSDEEVKFFEDLKIKWKSDYVTELDKKIEIFKQYGENENKEMKDIRATSVYDGYPIGTWTSQFRKKYRTGTLTSEEKEKLIEIGFVFEADRFISFEEKIKILEEYCKEHKKTLNDIKSGEKYKDYLIGNWIDAFKRRYHATSASEEERKKIGSLFTENEIKQLERLGIKWDKIVFSFEEKIKVLKEYCVEYGGLSQIKRKEIYKGFPIGNWIADFRLKKNEERLSSYEEAELMKLGMAWNSNKIVPFKEKYKLIKEYMTKENKKFYEILYEETYKGYPIGVWTSLFRTKYQAKLKGQAKTPGKRTLSALTDEEYNKLILLEGFTEKRVKLTNIEKINVLKRYCKNENTDLSNDSLPLQYEGYPILAWVNNLRRDHRNGKLNIEETLELENLNIVWDIIIPFDKKIEILKKYSDEKKRKISEISRDEQYEGYNIGYWMSAFKQRYHIKKELEEGRQTDCKVTPLTEVELEALNKIDSMWAEGKKISDRTKLKILFEYYKKHKSIANISQKEVFNGFPVGAWISQYRTKEKTGNLPGEIKEVLDKMKMKWISIKR